MPIAKVERVRVATPLLLRLCVARVVEPSRKATVPVGVPVAEVTVAVKVTALPKTEGFREEVKAVAEEAAVTVCGRVVLEMLKFVSPKYFTSIARTPAGSPERVSVATPLPFSAPEPTLVEP